MTSEKLKVKETICTYTAWRERLTQKQRTLIARLLRREAQSDTPVHTELEVLIVALVRLLDEGGETTEYIRDLYDAE